MTRADLGAGIARTDWPVPVDSFSVLDRGRSTVMRDVKASGGQETAAAHSVSPRRCRERIASYKVPKSLDFLENFPRTPSGKVQKAILRKEYQG